MGAGQQISRGTPTHHLNSSGGKGRPSFLCPGPFPLQTGGGGGGGGTSCTIMTNQPPSESSMTKCSYIRLNVGVARCNATGADTRSGRNPETKRLPKHSTVFHSQVICKSGIKLFSTSRIMAQSSKALFQDTVPHIYIGGNQGDIVELVNAPSSQVMTPAITTEHMVPKTIHGLAYFPPEELHCITISLL